MSTWKETAKAGEGEDSREEAGSEGSTAHGRSNSTETPGPRAEQVKKSRHLSYLGSREERKHWV